MKKNLNYWASQVKNVKGAIMLDNKYINPFVDFVASIDCKTGKLIKSEGRLTWLIKDEKSRNGYEYDF